MKNIYKLIEPKKSSLLQRLFNSPPSENAIIDLNNLFATKPIKNITIKEIEDISEKYNIDFYKKFSNELKEFYTSYLKHCLEDHSLSNIEIEELKHLKNILGLNDMDIEELHNSIAGEIYQMKMNEVISDGRLEKVEEEALEKLQKQLMLPDSISKKISSDTRELFVHDFLNKAISDQRLSEAELFELEAITNSLNVKVEFGNATKELLEKFKHFWIIENCELPIIPVSINLQKNEHCYFSTETEWLEYRSIIKRINYGGPTVRVKIMKGVYYRAGSMAIQPITSEELRTIDYGTAYVTNKRLIFMGIKKNTNIQLSKMLSLTPYSDGVGIEKDSGKSPILRVSNNAGLMAMILGRVINDL